MKNPKRIWLGFIFISALLGGAFLATSKVLAVTNSPGDIKACIDTISFQDIAHLTCKVNGQKITFTDNNPTDTNPDPLQCSASAIPGNCSLKPNFAPPNYNLFCDPGDTSSGIQIVGNGTYYHPGITGRVQSGAYTTDSAGQPASLEVNLGYLDKNTNKCTRYPSGGGDGIDVTTNNTAGISNLLQFYNLNNQGPGSGIESLSGVKGNTALGGKSYVLQKGYISGEPGGSSETVAYTSGFTSGQCGGDIVLVTTNGSSQGVSVSAVRYPLTGGNQDLSAYPDLLAFMQAENVGQCSISSNSGGINFGVAATSFSIYGTPPTINNDTGQTCDPTQPAPSGYSCSCIHDETGGQTCTLQPTGSTTSPPGGGGTTTKSCESNFNSPFDWIVCGSLRLADEVFGAFYSFVEQQLCFKTDTTSSTGGSVCSGKTLLTSDLKKDWTIFKNIASGLLVIILLIAVIAQAVGSDSGPLSAYNIKKILPKAVAAVILMQVSWYLLKYAIDLSNDAGYGIKNLLLAPFGGTNAIQLDKLVGYGVHTAVNTSIAGGDAFGFFYIIAGAIATYWVIPALPLLALYDIIAVIVAFITLILRKIFIIILVILAPLALVFWILPGTESYWKLWKDNFPKLLLMFPMIAALIAAGQIFASLAVSTSGSSSGGTGLGISFINIALVVAAWFAPYFLLPKTFSWGGSLMKAAGEAVTKGTERAAKKPTEYLKEVEKGWREQRQRDSQERVARGEPRKFTSLDMFRSGAWNPLLGLSPEGTRRLGLHKVPGLKNAQWIQEGSRRRNRQMRQYVESGEKSEKEYEAAAEVAWTRRMQKHRAEGGDHDLLLQAVADGRRRFYDRKLGKWVDVGITSKADRNAARKITAKLGAGMNWRYLANYYKHTNAHGTAEEKAEMRKFFDDNVDLIIGKLPHVYKSIHQAADADPGTIAGMHGVEVEEILSELSATINDPSKGAEEKARAQASLTKFLGNFNNAVENSKRGGPQLENGAIRAVKAFLDPSVASQLLYDINEDATGNIKYLHGRDGTKVVNRDHDLPDEKSKRVLEPLLTLDGATTPDGTVYGPVHVDAATRSAIDQISATLSPSLDPQGIVRGTTNGAAGGGGSTTPGVVISPGELRIRHEQTAARTLVPPANPVQREALKVQLRTAPGAAQALANNIAYDNNPDAHPEYYEVLSDMRREAAAPGADPALKDSYNAIINQVQQALQRRVYDTAAAAAARGRDAATAGDAATARLKPQIESLEASAPRRGRYDLRKLP